MKMQNIPAFGEKDFYENQANTDVRVWTIRSASHLFEKYRALYKENGYAEKEYYECNGQQYAALQNGTDGVFLTAYETTRELCIVEEADCPYFSYTDVMGEARFSPQITQVTLRDFGMSYVIRVSDGRLIVIDGGFHYDEDVEQLYRTLKEYFKEEKPVIAAWILTHTHEDHMQCFVGFMQKHAGDVIIEKMMFNFPAADDLTHYPDLTYEMPGVPNSAATYQIPLMLKLIEENGIPVFTPHTGQKYSIGDAELTFLACMDDTIHLTSDINALSLVFRMELGGQVILWMADAACSYARLAERYGHTLRADILQVPHHGFQCGETEAEIRAYDFVKPSVCLLPVRDYFAYIAFCQFRKGTKHLMCSDTVREMITGDTQRTLTLPYTARAGARAELERNVRQGAQTNGACAWIFCDLSTACQSDMTFTVLNTTVLSTSLRVELYFENKKDLRVATVPKIPGRSIRSLCLIGKEDAIFPKETQLPTDAPFAVRFLSEQPLVVSHPTHHPAYRSAL